MCQVMKWVCQIKVLSAKSGSSWQTEAGGEVTEGGSGGSGRGAPHTTVTRHRTDATGTPRGRQVIQLETGQGEKHTDRQDRQTGQTDSSH